MNQTCTRAALGRLELSPVVALDASTAAQTQQGYSGVDPPNNNVQTVKRSRGAPRSISRVFLHVFVPVEVIGLILDLVAQLTVLSFVGQTSA